MCVLGLVFCFLGGDKMLDTPPPLSTRRAMVHLAQRCSNVGSKEKLTAVLLLFLRGQTAVVVGQLRHQAQQMNALFQTKQLALKQKLQSGHITLKQAQQVSQMQQVSI